MQIFALDTKQCLVEASVADKQRDYFCPECGALVRLRGGQVRQLHFYHLKTIASCRLNGKSQTHLAIQYHLQNLFSKEKCFLERRFPLIGRIADVVWEPKKLIFEIQCSPITAAEIKARNRDYHSQGYRVVWILHDKRYDRSPKTSAEHALSPHPHYYTDIDERGEGKIYDTWLENNPSVIDLKSPYNPKARTLRHPFQRWRARRWKLAFKGDLLDQKLELPPKLRLPIKQLYIRLLHYFLRKAC